MGERNWAGNVEYRASRIEHPRSLDELRALVLGARRVRLLGTRHSFNDIADGDSLVSLEALADDIVFDAVSSTVSCNPAITYGRLSEALRSHRVGLHNLASLPHISVAGAIATATHGSGDRLGNLATAVTAIEIMRSDGELVRLDRDHPDFAGAVVNLGVLGAVTRVELRVEPEYQVAQHVFERLAWADLESNLDTITAAGDSVSLFTTYAACVEQVWVKRRAAAAVPSMFGATPATVDVHPVPGVSSESCTQQGGVPGLWSDRLPHFRIGFTPSSGDELQSELFVDRVHAAAAITMLRGLSAELAPQLLISEIRTIAADDLWMSPHCGRESIAFHFTWRKHPAEVTRLVGLVEASLAAFEPRPHWGKLSTLGAAVLAERYPQWARFADLMQRFDGRGAFRNAWVERTLLG